MSFSTVTCLLEYHTRKKYRNCICLPVHFWHLEACSARFKGSLGICVLKQKPLESPLPHPAPPASGFPSRISIHRKTNLDFPSYSPLEGPFYTQRSLIVSYEDPPCPMLHTREKLEETGISGFLFPGVSAKF